MKKILVCLVVGLALLSFQTPASAVPVGLELALLVDVSGSVDATEYALQKTGYVQAFQSAAVQSAIAGITGGIAVTFIEWSAGSDQAQLVGWTHITDAASANAFAAAINGASRAFSGNTAPGSAINYIVPQFATNGFEGSRSVIDVSGDGAENTGANTFNAATAALLAGINVNGLDILGEAGLHAWYQANIVTPGGGFLLDAATFSDFASAVETKIGTEISGVPEPATLLLLGAGLLGLAGFSRKRV